MIGTPLERAYEYLDGLQSSNWGRTFDLIHNKQSAAIYLARVLDATAPTAVRLDSMEDPLYPMLEALILQAERIAMLEVNVAALEPVKDSWAQQAERIAVLEADLRRYGLQVRS